jgi:tetratricopeptide (TPR) repeat protein/DNA-binding XRE family transcriptional regulator
MPRSLPPPLSAVLTSLRSAQGWTQKELARALGISTKTLSFHERGRSELTRERLETMVALMGLGSEDIDATLLALEQIRGRAETAVSPVGPTREERRIIERTAAAMARSAARVTRSELTRSFQAPRIEQARREAGELWAALKARPARERRALVESAGEYRSWALCERLCAESERAAAADARRAVELAELAVRVAGRVPGEESWRSRLQGYAWAHLGNARRVASDLPGAEEAFAKACPLWEAGAAGDPGLLPEGQVLDLEASLRRGQRRLGEALSLHDRALAVTQPANQGFILLNKAFTLEQMGRFEPAIEALERAALRVDARSGLRLLCVLRFNSAVNLCHLGRYGDAEALLPEVRGLAAQLGNELDLARVLWLEGRIAAGLKQVKKALGALSRVREEFISRGIAYDAALASLELAALHLEQGRTGQVKALARQMAPVFQSQGVHREALAALQLFCQAADQEIATVEMARRLVEYLHRARQDPKLRFSETEAGSL